MSIALLWETFVWLVFKLQKWLSLSILWDFFGDLSEDRSTRCPICNEKSIGFAYLNFIKGSGWGYHQGLGNTLKDITNTRAPCQSNIVLNRASFTRIPTVQLQGPTLIVMLSYFLNLKKKNTEKTRSSTYSSFLGFYKLCSWSCLSSQFNGSLACSRTTKGCEREAFPCCAKQIYWSDMMGSCLKSHSMGDSTKPCQGQGSPWSMQWCHSEKQRPPGLHREVCKQPWNWGLKHLRAGQRDSCRGRSYGRHLSQRGRMWESLPDVAFQYKWRAGGRRDLPKAELQPLAKLESWRTGQSIETETVFRQVWSWKQGSVLQFLWFGNFCKNNATVLTGLA